MIPTYNELVNLPGLIQAIHQYLPAADVVVVDDDSPDGTGNWCQLQAREDRRLHCLRRTGEKGYGVSILAGIKSVLAMDCEIVVTMDADFSHPPEVLPALVDQLGTVSQDHIDVVIGSRYVSGGRIEGWPLHRRVSSQAVNWLTRIALSLDCHDCSGGYRAYRTTALRRVDLTSIQSTGYSVLEEILWKIQHTGAKIKEFPIVFRDRKLGSSKLNLGEAYRSVGAIFRLGALHWLGATGENNNDK